jgi:hypothetical protein
MFGRRCSGQIRPNLAEQGTSFFLRGHPNRVNAARLLRL